MHRRDFLKSGAGLVAAAMPFGTLLAAGETPTEPFDYARLKGRARALSGQPYQAPDESLPKALAELDYDGYQSIHYRATRALWADLPLEFRAQFFHRGFRIINRVKIHEVVEGKAREIPYDPALFDLAGAKVSAGSLPKDLGFAGVRLHFHDNWKNDIAVFLGASYFRAVGLDARQFGLSARGLALDTGLNRPEEFPVFTEFWLERPAAGARHVALYALLDSPSVSGAYRFDITPGASLVMEVDAALYPRKAVERFGVAPLTSMYQCGENDRRMGNDWRPEIHDSDGLALWTGAGERLWRPLLNPPGVRANSYLDENPRGFGLLQRDRNFDHYQDDGVFYEKRPSLWVEPKGPAWGKGAVQLVELPTNDETSDNIVAYWTPASPPQPGQEVLFGYKLHWGTHAPFPVPLAQVVATRTGIGGIVGQQRKYFSWRFAVDFAGGELAKLGPKAKVEPVITASRGKVEITSARPQEAIDGYRAMFDLRPTDDSVEPVDLRLYLRLKGKPLTETWLYQWTPPPAAERKF